DHTYANEIGDGDPYGFCMKGCPNGFRA
ncbi:MAG: hypothetical protein JWQ55_6745, partial [Rhodopila sp.]|nr:hypothetical protein [Rhodopila sp.]